MAILVAAALTVGCRGSGRRVDLTATVVGVTFEAVTVEVKAEPGMNVGASIALRKGEGTPVGPDGVGRVTLPRARWGGYDGSDIEVSACASGFPKGRYGSTKAKLPVPIKSLTLIGADGFGVLALGGGSRAEAIQLTARGTQSVTGAPPSYWQPKEAKLPVTLAVPAGSRVKLAGVSAEASPTGLTTIEVDSAEVPQHVTLESLGDGATGSAIAAPVLALSLELTSAKGAPVRRELTWQLGGSPAWLVARLDAVPGGAKLTSVPVVDALVLRRTSGRVGHLGAGGTVGQARWVALETSTSRDGEVCPYSSFSYRIRYEDITVHVHDARTGKEVATKAFPSPKASCLIVASHGDAVRAYHVKDETIAAWLERGMAPIGGFPR